MTNARRCPLLAVLPLFVLGACQGSGPGVDALPGDPRGGLADASVSGATASDAQVPGRVTGSTAYPVDANGCKAQNHAGLSEAQVRALAQGGPGRQRIVYPYDGTVFPRGLAAPVLMWDGDSAVADAVYVHIHAKTFRYQACLKPDAAGRLTLPQEVWNQAAAGSTGKNDPFQVELTTLHGSSVAGPMRQQLIIAPGSLEGSVYYNSYSSAVARKGGAAGGAVLRIPAGGEAELFIGQRGCAGCHGASADGSRLVTNEGVYALTQSTPVNPPARWVPTITAPSLRWIRASAMASAATAVPSAARASARRAPASRHPKTAARSRRRHAKAKTIVAAPATSASAATAA
jgi:hypothetical protein